jgi:NDP-sugar pyrophosphorylase family protein
MAAKKLGLEPVIDPTASVRQATLGRYTEIGARTSFVESTMGDYSYVVNDSNIIYTTIGKFCSIAAMTRINPVTTRCSAPASRISPIAPAPISTTPRMTRASSTGGARPL